MLYLRRLRARIRFPRFRSMPRNRSVRKRHAGGLGLLVIAAVMMLIGITLYSRLTPIVRDMAIAASKNNVTKAINDAIYTRIETGDLDYVDMVRLEKDDSGKVTALITDMSKINTIKSEISYDVIKRLTDENITHVGIPIGNLIGGSIFSGKGLEIPVKIVAAGAVATNFSNYFTSAGINQTRHQIMVDVTVAIKVLIPGRTEKAEVSVDMTVAETVIVGSVPDSFTYFEESDKWAEGYEKYDIMT